MKIGMDETLSQEDEPRHDKLLANWNNFMQNTRITCPNGFNGYLIFPWKKDENKT